MNALEAFWQKIFSKPTKTTATRPKNSSDPSHPPCPHCSAPLPTARAKQCLKCHYDWHDPNNVRQLVDPKWNRFGIDAEKTYVLDLCQTADGKRYTAYREVSSDRRDPHAVLETLPASGAQFIQGGFDQYAEHLPLSDGQRFLFEAHGVWMTQAEAEYRPGKPEPWVNGIRPWLPPR